MKHYHNRFVTSCISCQVTKVDHRPPKAPLIPISESYTPMKFITMDIQYIPGDDKGYKYILLIGDLFSKYIETVALKYQLSSTIADALYKKWMLRHGCPQFLLSDQASNVDGNVVRVICDRHKIQFR